MDDERERRPRISPWPLVCGDRRYHRDERHQPVPWCFRGQEITRIRVVVSPEACAECPIPRDQIDGRKWRQLGEKLVAAGAAVMEATEHQQACRPCASGQTCGVGGVLWRKAVRLHLAAAAGKAQKGTADG